MRSIQLETSQEKHEMKEYWKELTDLLITISINKTTTRTKNRSRKRLHPWNHLLSGFLRDWFRFVIAPHHPHLNIDEVDERRMRKPHPQHVVSWLPIMWSVQCSSYACLGINKANEMNPISTYMTKTGNSNLVINYCQTS